jgi:hypothetical protein
MGSLIGSNDTYACDKSSCTLSCSSPSFPPNTCSAMQQNFLDGTPCGSGGRCNNGVCKGSSFGKEVSSWIQDHKPLVIGLSAGLGGLVLLLVASCIFQCCRRQRRPKKVASSPFRYAGWTGASPPGHWNTQVPQAWRTDNPPPYPAEAYGTTIAARGRMPSMRYA